MKFKSGHTIRRRTKKNIARKVWIFIIVLLLGAWVGYIMARSSMFEYEADKQDFKKKAPKNLEEKK